MRALIFGCEITGKTSAYVNAIKSRTLMGVAALLCTTFEAPKQQNDII